MRRDNIVMLPQIVYISSGEGIDMAELSDSEKLIFDTLKQMQTSIDEIRRSMAIKEELAALTKELDETKHLVSNIDKNAAINATSLSIYTKIYAAGIAFVASIASSVFIHYITGV